MAPRPPSPSRPTPLVLVGVLATSVVVVSAKPPSAPCGGTFDLFPLLFCALLSGAASLFVGSSWARAHFRGSCGSVGRWRSSPAAPEQHVGSFQRPRRWLWRGKQLGFSENVEEPNERYFASWNGCARQSSSWWSSSLAKGLHRRRTCCSWTSLPCSRVWRLQVVS